MANVDDFLSFLLFASGIGWICAGFYIAKPNLHGIKFAERTCNITSVETISFWNNLPSCSCGKGCSEEYPCLTVRGFYWSNDTSTNSTNSTVPVAGTFHSDFTALEKKCLYIPDCKKEFTENDREVHNYFTEHVSPRTGDDRYPSFPANSWYQQLEGNSTFYNYTNDNSFPCWGYEDTMYFDHEYSIILVYISLILPGVVFLFTLLCSFICGSDGQKEFVGGLLILPVLLIAGIIACLWEIISECLPRGCTDVVQSCGSCLKSAVTCQCLKPKSGNDNENDNENDIEMTDDERRGSVVSSGTVVLGHHNYSPTSSYNSFRRSSLPSSQPAGRVTFDVPESGPSYDVGGSDNLPPPPSYDDAVGSTAPIDSAPSYDEVVNRSFK